MPLVKTALPLGNIVSFIGNKVKHLKLPLIGRGGQVAAREAGAGAKAVANEGAAAAKGVVNEGAGAAKGVVNEGAGAAKGAVGEGAGAAKGTAGGGAEGANGVVDEKKPGFFSRVTKPVRDKAHAAGSWAFNKLSPEAQKKLIAANDWRVKNKLNGQTLMDVGNAGLMAYFAGNDLANGESIGSVAGNLAGFYAGSRAIRRFLPKGQSTAAGIGRFVGDMGAGMVGSIGLQYLGDKYMPIGRLAKPVDEMYETGPEMTKGAEENSMNKFAMIKEAEVGGVLAAFTDAGLMQKFAEDDFAYLTEKVAENLGDSYTVDDIAYVADALLSGGVEKTAEEVFIDETAPVFGYALMAKLAGEMDDDDLDDFVSGYFEGAGF